MSVKKYYLDKRTLKTPTINGSLANLQNVLDLKDYIEAVVDSSDVEFSTIVLEDGTAALPSLTNTGDLDTGLYFPSANNVGLTTGGTLRANISSTGLDVTGAITSTTTNSVGTALAIGTNVTLAKEVDHTVTVTTTTTAATAGGNLTITSGQGATSGNGGTNSLVSGAGGLTGAGGVVAVTSGAGGATSGASGAVNIASGAATVGSSGTVTIASGNTASGVAGDIQLTPGTHTSTTVSPVVSLNKAVIRKPATVSIATGATATGPELLSGHLSVTGATGNLTLPTAAQITTAIGSTPAGTYFDFVVNAVNMTATNVVTLIAGANTLVQKQISAGDSATDQLLTVTQTAGTNIGLFRICYITATTCSLHRIG